MISHSALEKLEFSKILKQISGYTSTEKGKTLILNLLPLNSSEKIKKETRFVTEAKNVLIEREHPPIEYMPDLDEEFAISRIEGQLIESKKMLNILKLLSGSRRLSQYLRNNIEFAPNLGKFASLLYVDKLLEHHISGIVDDKGDVKDSASKKISDIRKEIIQKKNELEKSVRRIIKNLTDKEIVREQYLTMRDGRIVIPVKSEHKRHIRGFIHSESSTGQTVYIEPEETLDLNNDILSLSFAEKREIERLLKELTKKIGTVANELKSTLLNIAILDSIFARASYSIEVIGSFPDFDNEKPFEIRDGRHPLLLKRLGKENTIPINISISDDKNIIIITGPNAGGKTVVLKTVGLLVIMVQSGIPIPASPDSNFRIFDNVLLDIGDEQSIDDDLSTFSSHLANIREILRVSTPKTLALVDEIGTGTDPAEGAAIASAVLIELGKKGTKVLATTHHGSLKLVANEEAGFENAAMEFDHTNLKPTYYFRQGIPGSSYAFEIAKRIGLDDQFLDTAKKYLDSNKHNIETFLSEIEAKSFELRDKLKKMEIENARLAGLSNLYKQNLDKLNKEKKEILKKAGSDAADYLSEVNKKVERVIKELKETQASTSSIKSAKNLVSELKEKNKELVSENVELSEEKSYFVVGDYATIKDTLTTGRLLEIDKNKNKATFLAGNIKMQVKLDSLVAGKQSSVSTSSNYPGSYSGVRANIRLDLRGQRALEAEFEIIKFVDDAYSSGLERIEILHGKGTGALRKLVHEILKNHSKVLNYFFAPIELGGEGITIAELSKD
ncbi:MAG TPA: endonuclease MutS2 [Ignavibacteriaceae bacterium]|nr:endonuclease MutS2 [Ignavibacteriaceae bacterium]